MNRPNSTKLEVDIYNEAIRYCTKCQSLSEKRDYKHTDGRRRHAWITLNVQRKTRQRRLGEV